MEIQLIEKVVAVGKSKEVIDALKKILKSSPGNIKALETLAFIYIKTSNYQFANEYITKALELDPLNYNFRITKGNILNELKKYEDALACFYESIKINANNSYAYSNMSNSYIGLNDFIQAVECSKIAIELNKININAYINCGIALLNLKKIEESIYYLETALAIDDKNYAALVNYANAYEIKGQSDRALKIYTKATEVDPTRVEAFIKIGIYHEERSNYSTASLYYEKAFNINPDYEGLIGIHFRTKNKICDWSNYHVIKSNIFKIIESNKNVIDPFTILTMTDDNSIIEKSIKSTLSVVYSKIKNINKFNYRKVNNKSKIKIGYISSDFYDHATMRLMLEMLENHSEKKFEIFLISLTQPIFDMIYERIHRKFQNRLMDYSLYTGEDLIEKLRGLHLDIAIDLKGYTKDSKPEIFAARIAPLQMNYLGYPGSSYLNNIDYIISDEYITPKCYKNIFSEKIFNLNTSYQVNNSIFKINKKERNECNLPLDKFIYCSFNGGQKITPDIARCWVRILNGTDDSVFWIFIENDDAKNNLTEFFIKNGISSNRIIFANKVQHMEHLNRMANADLHLDTFPYTAHTTCSDSIRAGVPILTIIGKSFASRVCASILKRFDASVLITESYEQYVNTAIELYKNKNLLRNIKNKISNEIYLSSFFNPKSYALELEKAYEACLFDMEKGR